MNAKEADVVIVGLGSAGGAAAIEAHDKGAKVLVLEKDNIAGGNTRLSGGTLRRFLDAEEVIKYYSGIFDETVNPAVIRKFVEVSCTNHRWFEEKCEAEFKDDAKVLYPPAPNVIWDFLPGASGMGGRSQFVPKFGGDPEKNGGYNLMKTLMHGVEKRNIEIMYDTAGKKLITGNNKEVLGIIAASPDGEVAIKANKGLILTCGGFHQNKEMQINYLSMPYMAQGCPGGTGDGITMTQEIGAKMWHMTGVSCGISYKVPGHDIPIGVGIRSPHYIYVDQTGKRFLNETGVDVHAMAFDFTFCVAEEMAYPRLPAYLIFDEECRESGQMLGHCPGLIMEDPAFSWSEDNKAEIEKGWIKMGWTVAELGKTLGFSAGILEAAVGEYNQAAVTGYDPKFKRTAATMAPLNKAPFYAIEVWPALLNTQGGPQRDEEARVLDLAMKPIPRLYSAGELGSIVNKFYPGGTNITEAIAFGRIAGANAANEIPVS
ncbi:MAG: FAD-binding protein [Deltaproteobacteria bacterium]|nr:FAD-binding protein [Deltaproteobacteria bacterium]